jgi:hypothetical protein
MTESSTVEPTARLHHMDALPVGTRLGEFEIQALLGVGGFGMVYQAFDHSLRRAVAIKEYMPCALVGRSEGQSLWVRTAGDAQTFQAGLASFVKEAQLLAQFDHPSLVKVFRIWEANNTAYMVMPLYVGMTLKQARAQMHQPPSEAWLRKLLWSVLDALRVLHEAQTLHRDISPDNIFLQDNGPPVLLDLGAARHAISDAERQHTAVLKVNYAPIEQYAAEPADGEALRQGPWSDLYSLGAVVYGCVCNDTPLPATLRAMRDRMVRFRRVAKTVQRQFGIAYSEAFVYAISEALHLQPKARPQSIDEFLALMDMLEAPDGGAPFHWREALEAPAAAQAGLTYFNASEDEVEPTRFMEPVAARAAVDLDIGTAFEAGSVEPAGGRAPVGDDRQASIAIADSGPEPAGRSAPPSQDPEQILAGRSKRVWMGAFAALLVVGVVAWWGLRAPVAVPSEDDDIITEWATPPTGAVEPVAFESPPEVIMAVAQEIPGQPVSGPTPMAAETEGGATRHAASRKAQSPRTAMPAPVAAATVEPAVPAPEPVPVRLPPPRPRAAAQPVQGPVEACANAGFLMRPMCIHQECQKPSLLSHPVCVENRKRLEAEAQARDFDGR